MTTASAFRRSAAIALLGLLLGLRVLASAGYMPELEHGRLTLMLCPDGEWTAPSSSMPGMSHHAPKTPHHQECAYAAAAAIPFAGGEPALSLLLLQSGFAVVAAITIAVVARKRVFERPFSTGPPIPA